MFVLFFSQRRSSRSQDQVRKLGRGSDKLTLEPRKGGGGHGGGGHGGGKGGGSKSGGSSSGSKSSSSGSSSSKSRGSPSINTNSGLGSRPASVSSVGGGPVGTIPGGFPFAGRSAGGGTRSQIYGTGVYGSGYPGVLGPGTIGRGFPFYFWPVVWWYGPDYLHPVEYGRPDNSTRPGGSLYTASFTNQNTTLFVLSDNTTVSTLIGQISSSCKSYIQNSSAITPSPYINNTSSPPRPEQAIQYYRASSIVLSLNGYNNSNALSVNYSSADTPTIPLPPWVNAGFVSCVNSTIGNVAPLVDASSSSALSWSPPSTAGLISMVWFLWMFLAIL